MTTMERLQKVLREVFDNPKLTINSATTADQVDGWDSLSHANVLVAVEIHFDIRFSPAEALTFRNVGDMANCIGRHLRR